MSITKHSQTFKNDPVLFNYEQERAERAQRLPLIKAELIKALAAIKACRAVIEYDGCGDEGQIESVEAFRANGESVSLETPPFALTVEGGEATTSLRDALDDYAWELLAITHKRRTSTARSLMLFRSAQIATLVERQTRYVMLVKVPGKDTETVVNALGNLYNAAVVNASTPPPGG